MSTIQTVHPGPPPGSELTPCHYVAAENLIDGNPQEREHVYLESAAGDYVVGVWEAQPYTEHIDAYPGDEFCSVVRGAVTLIDDEGGTSNTFRAGDSFTIEAGWAGVWKVEEPFLKIFTLCTTAK